MSKAGFKRLRDIIPIRHAVDPNQIAFMSDGGDRVSGHQPVMQRVFGESLPRPLPTRPAATQRIANGWYRMGDAHDIVSAWIGREILPHESPVRNWLSRRWGHVVDPNDVIQEAYCRIASLTSVDHIRSPMAYFYRTAQTVAADVMRRSGVINFTSMTEIEWLNVMDSEPLADRAIGAAQELERVSGLLSELSDTARKAIELRRIEGVSQREAAERLGVSEDVIRNHLVRGVQKVLKAMAAQDAQASGGEQEAIEKKAAAIDTSRSL